MASWNELWNTKKILPRVKARVIVNNNTELVWNTVDISAVNNYTCLGLNNWLLCDTYGSSVAAFPNIGDQALADGTFNNDPTLKLTYDSTLPIIKNNILSITWNSFKKSYAVNFQVTITYTAASGKASATYSVVNNTDLVSAVSVDTEYMESVLIEVQKWSLPNDYACIDNVVTNYSILAEDKLVKSIKHIKTNSLFSSEAPSMTAEIQLYNENDDYNPTNPTAKYKNTLVKGTGVSITYLMESENLSFTAFNGVIKSFELSNNHNYITLTCCFKIDIYESEFDMSNIGTVPLSASLNDIATAICTQNGLSTTIYNYIFRNLQINLTAGARTVAIKSNTGMSCAEFMKLAIMGDNAFTATVQNNSYNSNNNNNISYSDFVSFVNNTTVIDNDYPNLDLHSMIEEPTIEVKEKIYSVDINNGQYSAVDNNYSGKETIELTYPMLGVDGQTLADGILDLYNRYNKRVKGKFNGNPGLLVGGLLYVGIPNQVLPMITTKYGTYPFYPTYVEIEFDGGFSGTFEAILCQEDS